MVFGFPTSDCYSIVNHAFSQLVLLAECTIFMRSCAAIAGLPKLQESQSQFGSRLWIIPENPESSPAMVSAVLRVVSKELQERPAVERGFFGLVYLTSIRKNEDANAHTIEQDRKCRGVLWSVAVGTGHGREQWNNQRH